MPTDDAETRPGYGDTADAYWRLGWRSILPLPPRSKVWPPSIKCADARAKRQCKPGCECVHYTGYDAVQPSYPDLMSWIEQFPQGNLCLHLGDGFVGVDIDAYDSKTGAQAFAEAIRRWGPLPPAVRTTSRDDGVSGIRIFRVPPGTVLETRINFPELGIGDIEIVQSHHRYAISWPSVHPDTGETYRWLDDDDQPAPIPDPEALPWLPQTWIDGLRRQAQRFDGEINVDVSRALTEGEPSQTVTERLRDAIKAIHRPGASRHDVCCRHVLALARLGISGQPGVKSALQTLCAVLVSVRAADGSGDETKTRNEFIRMLTNDQLARELSQPGVTDWIDMLVTREDLERKDPAVRDGRVGESRLPEAPDPSPRDDSPALPAFDPTTDSAASSGEACEAAEPVTTSAGMPITVEPSAPRSDLEELERGFWDARESLAKIRHTSLARMAAPWATLGICAARALTCVRPNATLPPLVGGPGSLNMFIALVAPSGGGKGAAGGAADLLIPRTSITQRNLGSGEGLVKLYDRAKSDDPDAAARHEALLINVDEVDTLVSMSQRSGSTTTSVLRSAFSGEALGWAYVNRSGLGDIPDHSYRMTLVVSVQPKQSGGLLAGEGGGLPQRFMWFSAVDSRITGEDMWPSAPLTLPSNHEWLYPREIQVPIEVRDFVKANRVRVVTGNAEALDGHAVFCREKFAYALAVLDGRVEMTLEDWELSGIAADVSTHTREWCRDQLREAARIDALDRGEIRGIENHAADDAKEFESAEKVRRLVRWVMKQLEAHPNGLTAAELKRRAASRDRRWMDSAAHVAVSSGLVGVAADAVTLVKI